MAVTLLFLSAACGVAPGADDGTSSSTNSNEETVDFGNEETDEDGNDANGTQNQWSNPPSDGGTPADDPDPDPDPQPDPDPDPDPEPEPSAGACDNAADEEELADIEDTLDDVVGDCALGCLLSSDKTTCGAECVSDNTNLSDGCAHCFGAIIECTAANCSLPCGINAAGESCASCREENCNSAFEQCAGIPAR